MNGGKETVESLPGYFANSATILSQGSGAMRQQSRYEIRGYHVAFLTPDSLERAKANREAREDPRCRERSLSDEISETSLSPTPRFVFPSLHSQSG
jgi:hypothetical protein